MNQPILIYFILISSLNLIVMGQDLKDILFHRNVTLRPILNNEPFQSQGNNDRRRSLSVSDCSITTFKD
ncbi:hypothetical protein BLOT_010242 [Blomia tropicalis]|nr:hypothetical protein BLOT_010242 [Blomia tropicalis]